MREPEHTRPLTEKPLSPRVVGAIQQQYEHSLQQHAGYSRRRVARLMALGLTAPQIRQQTGLKGTVVKHLMRRPDVQSLAEQYAEQFEDAVMAGLVDAEHKAVSVLIELLEDPNPDIRLKAVVQALDRAGKRGRPVERVQQQTLTLTADALPTAVRDALRDPGVRAWLDARPEARAQLAALAPPAAEDPHVPARHNELQLPE